MKCSGINCPMQYPYDVKKCLCVDTCPYATTVPYTNAERIRAMSDEELAVFLDDLTCLCVDCNDHDGVNENCPIYKQGCGRYCEPKDLMDWLQQPAEEDT